MVSGGSKSYTIKPLLINHLFSRTLLEVFILYFDKIRQILIICGCILILHKGHGNKTMFQLSLRLKFTLD